MDESARVIEDLRHANKGLERIVNEQADELHVWRRDGGQAFIDKQDALHTVHRRNLEIEELHHRLHARNLEIEKLHAEFADAHHQLHARNLEIDALRHELAEVHHQLHSRNTLIIELQSRLESAR